MMIRTYFGLFVLFISCTATSASLIDSLESAKEHFKNKQYKEAFNIWLPLAKQGYADPMLRVGKMYSEGIGVKKDAKRAEFWVSKAKDKGVEDIEENRPCGTSIGGGVIMNMEQMSSDKCLKYSCASGAYQSAYGIAKLKSEGNTKTFVNYLIKKSYPPGSVTTMSTAMELDMWRISTYYTYDKNYPAHAVEEILRKQCVAVISKKGRLDCKYDAAMDKVSCQ